MMMSQAVLQGRWTLLVLSSKVVTHAASSGLVASLNPIAAIPFARASGKGLL